MLTIISHRSFGLDHSWEGGGGWENSIPLVFALPKTASPGAKQIWMCEPYSTARSSRLGSTLGQVRSPRNEVIFG